MKKLFYVGLSLVVMFSCGKVKKDLVQDYDAAVEIDERSTPHLTVDQFASEAGTYVDQEVAIAGIVDHVCKHSGKKLLLVTDGGSVHVTSETRFDDKLVGNQIQLTGIVKEERIDESTCLQMEEDNIKQHREGVTNEEQYSNKLKQIQHYRDSMATAGIDHLSYYSLEFVSLKKEVQ